MHDPRRRQAPTPRRAARFKERSAAVNAITAESMRRYGFVIHYIFNPEATRERPWVNAHTHGLDLLDNGTDFQIVIPAPQQVVAAIFHEFAGRIKKGESFRAGQEIEKIIQKLPVRLAPAKEAGRDVLRVILPDKNGKFPGDEGVDPKYAEQPTAEADM